MKVFWSFCCDLWDYKERMRNEYSSWSNSKLQTFLQCFGSSCFAALAQICLGTTISDLTFILTLCWQE